jgi:hypothetical protein
MQHNEFMVEIAMKDNRDSDASCGQPKVKTNNGFVLSNKNTIMILRIYTIPEPFINRHNRTLCNSTLLIYYYSPLLCSEYQHPS